MGDFFLGVVCTIGVFALIGIGLAAYVLVQLRKAVERATGRWTS